MPREDDPDDPHRNIVRSGQRKAALSSGPSKRKQRKKSLLEDDDLSVLGRNEPSSGDICETCGCERGRHTDGACMCGKCDGFDDG